MQYRSDLRLPVYDKMYTRQIGLFRFFNVIILPSFCSVPLRAFSHIYSFSPVFSLSLSLPPLSLSLSALSRSLNLSIFLSPFSVDALHPPLCSLPRSQPAPPSRFHTVLEIFKNNDISIHLGIMIFAHWYLLQYEYNTRCVLSWHNDFLLDNPQSASLSGFWGNIFSRSLPKRNQTKSVRNKRVLTTEGAHKYK